MGWTNFYEKFVAKSKILWRNKIVSPNPSHYNINFTNIQQKRRRQVSVKKSKTVQVFKFSIPFLQKMCYIK